MFRMFTSVCRQKPAGARLTTMKKSRGRNQLRRSYDVEVPHFGLSVGRCHCFLVIFWGVFFQVIVYRSFFLKGLHVFHNIGQFLRGHGFLQVSWHQGNLLFDHFFNLTAFQCANDGIVTLQADRIIGFTGD